MNCKVMHCKAEKCSTVESNVFGAKQCNLCKVWDAVRATNMFCVFVFTSELCTAALKCAHKL